MIKKLTFYFSLLTAPFTAFSQINEGLTAEERAYLYHIVKKSEILDNNIGRYLDYKGPMVYLPNKKINYDSLELIILNQPELLIIRKDEIARSPKGILGETSNKMAMWELNKVLLAKRIGEKELEPYRTKYENFERYLMEKLPEDAKKGSDGELKPTPKIINLLNPGLSFEDKTDFLETLRFKDPNVDKAILDAISYAINSYVEARSKYFYHSLGGKADVFENYLVAAGDGSSTSGMLNEKERDDKGRWNRGLPKAVGLFPYQTKLEVVGDKKKETVVEPMRYAVLDMKTTGNWRYTQLHFDVWGYNTEKQTTVVIEKNGLSYPLFGSGETRFLSPDSTFSKGITMMAIINDLKSNKITKLNEMIYGKRGFDYWIEYNKKKKDETELKIEKQEYGYSALHNEPAGTDKKASKKEKKAKKHITHPDADKNPPRLTNRSDKKDKKVSEASIVDLYNLFDTYKKKIADLELQKSEALDLLAIYQQRLDTYYRLMGQKWAKYTEENGLYIFEDSSTFDMLTQEFSFPPGQTQEDFEVRLVAIPESSISDEADEVMLHVGLCDLIPNQDARFGLELNDLFESDKWELHNDLLMEKDSVAVLQFFEALLNKKNTFEIIARAQGIGKWNGSRTVKDAAPVEISAYPGSTEELRSVSKMAEEFVRLRTSEVFIHLNRGIRMEVNSYTDPVASSISINDAHVLDLMQRYNLNKNDILSAYRTAAILNALKVELNVLAGTYLDREKARIVIDRFNKEFAKIRISIGPTSLKLSEIKL
jgi:hypothetical protein